MKNLDNEYAKRIREGCFKAIIEGATIDGQIQLNESAIIDAVATAVAMIHTSQDVLPTEETTRLTSEALASQFRDWSAAFKGARKQIPPTQPTKRRRSTH